MQDIYNDTTNEQEERDFMIDYSLKSLDSRINDLMDICISLGIGLAAVAVALIAHQLLT